MTVIFFLLTNKARREQLKLRTSVTQLLWQLSQNLNSGLLLPLDGTKRQSGHSVPSPTSVLETSELSCIGVTLREVTALLA